jgi:hypothetical protein
MKETALNKVRNQRFPINGKFRSLLKISRPSTEGKGQMVSFKMRPEVEPWYQDVIHIGISNRRVVHKEWISD